MQQTLHLGDMLKAKLAEKQLPVQLSLFDDADYVVHEVEHAMSLSISAFYELREQNPHAFYRIKAIRDAVNRLRAAERHCLKTLYEIVGITN